ncbi:MAG: hypothetical protein RJA22_2395 [Verrucomicrobiota bacterium]
MTNFAQPDLTRHPPRSPRVRLGGYAVLARMLDKGRADLAGRAGEYHYGCPLDQRLLQFLGLDAESLRAELAGGRSDREILAWIEAHGRHKRTAPEILAWSAWQEQRVPGDPEARAYFNNLHTQVAPEREDVMTWFDLLDLDDFVSFGGKP